MRLYLLRHGHSPSIMESGVRRDADRPLSEHGRQDVAASIRRLQDRGGKPSLILHSPLKRAQETAQEAALLLKASDLRLFEPLANVMPAEQLYRELEGILKAQDEVLAVGHQPQLGELAALAASVLVDFKPAGLAALELAQPPKGRLLWSYNP